LHQYLMIKKNRINPKIPDIQGAETVACASYTAFSWPGFTKTEYRNTSIKEIRTSVAIVRMASPMSFKNLYFVINKVS